MKLTEKGAGEFGRASTLLATQRERSAGLRRSLPGEDQGSLTLFGAKRMADSDPFQLSRFVEAQAPLHETALEELRAGRKRSHWMWFVFPQLAGLGFSSTAQFFGISGLQEARAYLAHPVLGARLRACTQAMLDLEGRSLASILGSPDDLKFCSSMTLFDRAANGRETRFGEALACFCGAQPDARTLELLAGSA